MRGMPKFQFQAIYDLFSQEFIHKLHNYRKCREVAEELDHFPEARHILEVGTAEGFLLRYMLRNRCIDSAVGYDIRPVRIGKAIQRARDENLDDRLTFLVGDGKTLPFQDGSFDETLLPHVLEHVPTREQIRFLIMEALRVSIYGILIALPLRDSHRPVLRWSKYLDPDHLHGLLKYGNGWIYHAESVERFFRGMGLDYARSEANDRVYRILKFPAQSGTKRSSLSL